MTVPVFVRGLNGSTSCVHVDLTASVHQLKELIEAREGVPSEVQGLVYQGRQLQDELSLQHYQVSCDSTVHLVLGLRGGKGGFGALLRGLGRDGNVTTNFDAMRDLSGRRLRHQNIEEKLKEWKADAKGRDLEKVAMQHIKELAKQQKREEREQVDEEAIIAAQEAVAAKTKAAVQEAIASSSAAGKTAVASTSTEGAGKKRSAPDAAAATSGASSSKQASGSAAAAVPAAKKPRSKMLAMLEESGSEVSSDEDA